MTKEIDGIKRKWGERLLSKGKLAASAARLATRRLLGSKGPQDEQLGEALAQEMDKMKGMAMKVGQILSYFDGILPEETHKALHKLQHGITPVSFPKMEQVITEAFGQPLHELFDDFQTTPIASASIGQVYRATYKGQPVVVKVQYPGIWDTIQSDFSLLHKISRLASLASAVDGPAIVAELRERFGEECDYLREAAHQNAYAKTFANAPDVHIPHALLDRTRQTVITSEYCEGSDFYTFTEGATQARRNEVAQVLVRFALQSFYGLGMINADPHPGNYLFPDQSTVVFLDFGCVRRFDPEFIEAERELARVVTEDRRSAFREVALATQMISRPDKFDFDNYWEMMRHQYAPYCHESFRFTKEYISAGMKHSQPSNPNLRYLAIPPQWIWLQRLQWGLHAVLTRLHAEGNFQALFQEALARPLQPLKVAA